MNGVSFSYRFSIYFVVVMSVFNLAFVAFVWCQVVTLLMLQLSNIETTASKDCLDHI